MTPIVQILIAFLTNKTTTDLIVNSMVKTVSKLDKHAEKSTAKVSAHEAALDALLEKRANEIDALLIKRKAALDEAERAANIAKNIGNLLA